MDKDLLKILTNNDVSLKEIIKGFYKFMEDNPDFSFKKAFGLVKKFQPEAASLIAKDINRLISLENEDKVIIEVINYFDREYGCIAFSIMVLKAYNPTIAKKAIDWIEEAYEDINIIKEMQELA